MEILREFNLRGVGEPVALKGAMAAANFFPAFGFRFSLGNGFVEDHDRPGQERVVVFSHWFWQRHFGGDTNVLGKALMIDRLDPRLDHYRVNASDALSAYPSWSRSAARQSCLNLGGAVFRMVRRLALC